MMTFGFRLRQALLIARLELSRVFFARRSLWVYLLAVFPAIIFTGHGTDVTMRRQRLSSRVVSSQLMDSVSEGQTIEEVRKRLGEPHHRWDWRDEERNIEHRGMEYFDGKNRRMSLNFVNGMLTRVENRPVVDFEEDRTVFATIFQQFYLRLAIFFGCLGIFMNLFRGEMLDKTLHYWLLAPARRETLLAGKYLAGLTAATLIFAAGTVISFYGVLWYQYPADAQVYWREMGMEHLAWYVAASVLACLGYGSLFLAAGLLVRNPIMPAITLLIWEGINPFLPAVLQKFTVLHYVQSICPVPAADVAGSDAPALIKLLLAPPEPASVAATVFGLLALTALVLWAAARAVRRIEINYGTE